MNAFQMTAVDSWTEASRHLRILPRNVELLIFVTPEFCEAMDPHEVPPCGPGELTTSPTDCELYGKGYLEVPKNCIDGNCAPGGAAAPFGPIYEGGAPQAPVPTKDAGSARAPAPGTS